MSVRRPSEAGPESAEERRAALQLPVAELYVGLDRPGPERTGPHRPRRIIRGRAAAPAIAAVASLAGFSANANAVIGAAPRPALGR